MSDGWLLTVSSAHSGGSVLAWPIKLFFILEFSNRSWTHMINVLAQTILFIALEQKSQRASQFMLSHFKFARINRKRTTWKQQQKLAAKTHETKTQRLHVTVNYQEPELQRANGILFIKMTFSSCSSRRFNCVCVPLAELLPFNRWSYVDSAEDTEIYIYIYISQFWNVPWNSLKGTVFRCFIYT